MEEQDRSQSGLARENRKEGRKMKETLRHRIWEIFIGWDHLQLSQFAIDWIQDFEHKFSVDVDDHAIAYQLDTIQEVLANGRDKDFFEMLNTFARLYIGQVGQAKGK